MYCEREAAAQIGRLGEEKTAQYLKSRGYIIIKRNWRDSRYGEIDIIAEGRENILFVEVRTRKAGAIVTGAESVDAGKLVRVKNAAMQFMSRFNSDLPFRVDVADMAYQKSGDKITWQLRYIENV